jgi:ABC-type cobalamin/Fe3+-siderophores transport system ATPase subunit
MLDEPCANLDFTWKYRIANLVAQLQEQTPLTVLMISHDTSVLPPACRRVLLLSEGRILADGDPETVLSGDTLGRVYGSGLTGVAVGGRTHIVDAGHP